jgi:hypothetical protein
MHSMPEELWICRGHGMGSASAKVVIFEGADFREERQYN